jgi:hypothetical protein
MTGNLVSLNRSHARVLFRLSLASREQFGIWLLRIAADANQGPLSPLHTTAFPPLTFQEYGASLVNALTSARFNELLRIL